MLEDLKRTCKGQPQDPGRAQPALTSFSELEPADPMVWRTAKLPSVFNYLRKNKRLAIPVEWQAVVPHRLQEVSQG